MRRYLGLLFLLFWAAVLCPASPTLAAEAAATGVVVLHGKQGSPDKYVTELASALRAAGFLVAAPEMAWSRRRAYDASYQEAMQEIDAAVRELRSQGAAAVAVAGHSLGANAALAYASQHPGLAGVVCLAPGHNPERPRVRDLNTQEVQKARELVAAGRGGESVRFTDTNMGNTFGMVLPAAVFLSYFDPEGLANMPQNAAGLGPQVPLLWVVGKRDPLARLGPDYAFARAPANPLSRSVEVDADHLHVPAAAAELVIEWLRGLDAPR
ncbi:MAG: alpha/beta fold hydrolase [Humidesulfovibrio sp.]|nr:alpha/beta fold hydrolase [Humidesulfovibrio sp.]